MQEPQPLGQNFTGEKIDTGRVAARLRQAGDETELDRVFAHLEDDRNRRGRRFGPERSGGVAGGDDSNTAADEISHERRQTIVAALQPVVLDRHVLALEVAGFLEAFTKRGTVLRGAFRRAGVDQSHHRHSRLLRARRERPCAAAPPSSVMNSRRLMGTLRASRAA